MPAAAASTSPAAADHDASAYPNELCANTHTATPPGYVRLQPSSSIEGTASPSAAASSPITRGVRGTYANGAASFFSTEKLTHTWHRLTDSVAHSFAGIRQRWRGLEKCEGRGGSRTGGRGGRSDGSCRGGFLHSRFHAHYLALPTTQACAWMLPNAHDAPLVLHIACLFIGLETIQATSFYFRYRFAVQANEEALRQAQLEADAEDEEEEEGGETDVDGVGEASAAASPRDASESCSGSPRTARARLPHGSSRAMHRLCSYWVLVERAVQRAPQKPPGVPTTAVELGRFFTFDGRGKSESGEENASGAYASGANETEDNQKRQDKCTSDGVPRGAEKVLVLPLDSSFPILRRRGTTPSTTSSTGTRQPTMASSMDAIMMTAATATAETRSPATAAHPAPSPPSVLPPLHPSSEPTTAKNTTVSLLPPAAAAPNTETVDASSTGKAVLTAEEETPEVARSWEVLHLLWTDTVRYSVSYTEIRQLLLACTPSEIAKLYEEDPDSTSGAGGTNGSSTARGRVFRTLWRGISSLSRATSTDVLSGDSEQRVDSPIRLASPAATFSARMMHDSSAASARFAEGRVCVVCLALTWYLALVRDVYEAVVVHEDVQRCADAMEELEEYSKSVYELGIDAGATFFEEAMRYADAALEDGNRHPSQHPRGGGGGDGDGDGREDAQDTTPSSHGRLLLPQVSHNSNTAMCSQDTLDSYSSSGPLLQPRTHPSPLGHVAHSPPSDAQPNYGPAHSNPLDFVFSPSPPPPSSPHLFHGSSLDEAVAGHGDFPTAGLHITQLRVACPRACWAELTAALAALLRRRRLMELACVRSLFSYMYTGSATKIVTFTILTLLTTVSSHIAALGQVAREAISTNLDTYYRTCREDANVKGGSGGVGRDCQGNEGTPAQQRILALCAFECTRLAINTVLTKVTNEYIGVAASQRRNTAKAELYEALTRMPLAFFDLHSYDEVERIVYYVNDIEGVEVHVHNYACGLITSLFALHHAMRQLPTRARLLVGATVAASLTVKFAGQKVSTWTQAAQRTGGVIPPWLRGYGLDGTATITDELDAQVEENLESNARQGGVMLRGLDIVALLPQLRPYAADLSLMRWWTDHTRKCGQAMGSTEAVSLVEGLMVLPRQFYGKMIPAFGAALMTFADWVLPTLVASYGASMALTGVDALSLSNRLMEAMRCVGDMIDSLVDARRVIEVVLLNAYKANVLERVLDPRRWEPTTYDYSKGLAFAVAEAEESDDGDAEPRGQTNSTVAAPAEADRSTPSPIENNGAEASKQQQLNARAASSSTTAITAAFHQRQVGLSFRRASTLTKGARLWRRVCRSSAWFVAHSPPVLMVYGTMKMLYVVLRGLGLVSKEMRPSRDDIRKQKAGLRRPRKHRRHSHHRQQHHGHPPLSHDDPSSQGASQTPHSGHRHRLSHDGSAAAAVDFTHVDRAGSLSEDNRTEPYYSDNAPQDMESDDDAAVVSSSTASSSHSFSGSGSSCDDEHDTCTDNDDLDSEAAAAAAAAVLVQASVRAVTVQNLQFYYPTAPTVPVFPRPITCTFSLQTGAWDAPSKSAPHDARFCQPRSSESPRSPAHSRLVCLVGPSGHGKSTLLNLLLGMYTHYGGEAQRGHAAAFVSPSAGSSPVGGGGPTDYFTGEHHPGEEEEDGRGRQRLSDRVPTDVLAASHLPPDIFLTLRFPRDADEEGKAERGDANGRARSLSPLSQASSASGVIEEQLPVAAIPRDILRGNLFSFVPQNPVIFSGATIAHNISLENYISIEQEELLAEIAQCAAWAHCEYIQKFPQGLMTYIADSGTGGWSSPLAASSAGSGGAGGGGGVVRLSGGQAQRLMMARALFHGRRGGTVLVMDEPTASLDQAVKQDIMREWRDLLDKGIVRGMICATHDADLVKMADEVVRLP